ncbi:hypothetical protein K493DRAFT_297504 [Basidiobolus meristosporus CBS 931.73]|uniref:Transmembrane protein 231 n=1 Tax=Basidiobolus meristosporus CBS 931.73 TaxID=1314790 RepID=A0A1Y1YZB9_9FUNG|nr:hypothetical protein K493DRAFT_297504 [Basidiobolus meristosporus CBS 931.73]|eukprot:ORY03393.1 hypothetical protein K493DRAFT_297504 [Basidiobolus meristosporus CBS 931.73]
MSPMQMMYLNLLWLVSAKISKEDSFPPQNPITPVRIALLVLILAFFSGYTFFLVLKRSDSYYTPLIQRLVYEPEYLSPPDVRICTEAQGSLDLSVSYGPGDLGVGFSAAETIETELANETQPWHQCYLLRPKVSLRLARDNTGKSLIRITLKPQSPSNEPEINQFYLGIGTDRVIPTPLSMLQSWLLSYSQSLHTTLGNITTNHFSYTLLPAATSQLCTLDIAPQTFTLVHTIERPSFLNVEFLGHVFSGLLFSLTLYVVLFGLGRYRSWGVVQTVLNRNPVSNLVNSDPLTFSENGAELSLEHRLDEVERLMCLYLSKADKVVKPNRGGY